MTDDGVSVLLSSHVLAELERVADYLILLSRGRVQVAGEVAGLLARHRMLTGPTTEADKYAERPVVHARRAQAQAHLLVRATADNPVPPGWEAHPVDLEELTLAYLREPGAAALPGPSRGRGTQPSEVNLDDPALTMRTRPGHDARLRPVPWRRMAWVTWRQHRAALACVAVFLGALAVYLWLTGLQMHHAYAADCHPASSLACNLNFSLDRRNAGEYHQGLSAGGAWDDRGVCRGAGAGPGDGDRDLPVRLDPGFRPVALGAGQAGTARGRGGSRRRGVHRAVLLVRQPVLRRGLRDPVRYRPVRPARGLVRRLDAGRLRDRRPGRDAHPPGRPRDRRHPGRLRRARPRDRAVAAPALHDTAAHQQPERARFRVDRQRVVHQGRQVRVRRQGLRDSQRRLAALPSPRGRFVRPARAVPLPARVHDLEQLSARQPVLALPVDRGRLAARAVGAAHRGDRLAGPPPRGLTRLARSSP